MSKAERDSYGYVEQTCPIVDALTATCLELIQEDLENKFRHHIEEDALHLITDQIQYRVETLIGKIKENATEKLRAALIDSIQESYSVTDCLEEEIKFKDKEIDNLERQVDVLEYENQDLSLQISDLNSDVERLEKEVEDLENRIYKLDNLL